MRVRTKRSGFTLVELMAAMAILAIMVLMIGRIFSDSTKIWKLGTRRVSSAVDGRAVIDFMVREMSSAVADGTLVMAHKLNADSNILGMDSDRIYFVTLDQKSESKSAANTYRQGRQVSYHIEPMRDINGNDIPNRFRIMRSGIEKVTSGVYTCYTDPDWWQQPEMNNLSAAYVLAENVRTLEFWVYDRDGKLVRADDPDNPYGASDTYTSLNKTRGIGWVEIYLEMLGEDDAIRAALLTGQAAIDFADRASRRYVGRVYFHNGRGYAPDT